MRQPLSIIVRSLAILATGAVLIACQSTGGNVDLKIYFALATETAEALLTEENGQSSSPVRLQNATPEILVLGAGRAARRALRLAATPTLNATLTSAHDSVTPTVIPAPTSTPMSSSTATDTLTSTYTATPSPTATDVPTSTYTATPSPTATDTPPLIYTATPSPTTTPAPTPTPAATSTPRPTPTALPDTAKAIQIAAGRQHACVLLDTGQVKCWGYNAFGQLGQGHKNLIGDQKGEMGDNLAIVELGDGRTAVRIVSGPDVNCAILDNNELKCWGDNQFGQLGQGHKETIGDEEGEMGDELPPIDLGKDLYALDVSIGETFVCALTNDGRVICWGANRAGQLGHGIEGGDEPGGIKNQPRLVEFRNDDKVIQIASGLGHTCALFVNGDIRCWGENESGQLGLGHTKTMEELKFRPRNVSLGEYQDALSISAGNNHTCVMLEQDRAIKCWGADESGELGRDANLNRPIAIGDERDEMGEDLSPLRFGQYSVVDQIVAGPKRTCAIIDGDSIKCWGDNQLGQLGLGHNSNVYSIKDVEPIDLGSEVRVKQLALGGRFTCALLESGDAKCWGSNDRGELGQGHNNIIGDHMRERNLDNSLDPIDFGIR